MKICNNLLYGDKILLTNRVFSGEYNQIINLKRAKEDIFGYPKYYLEIDTIINNNIVHQGYLYFYLDNYAKTSFFIGLKVEENFRHLNIASLLIATYLQFCFNNGYKYIKMYHKQRKPFITYLLKTYGFEVNDLSLYEKRNDIINIYRDYDYDIKTKLLLFKDPKHEDNFLKTNIYQDDDYEIIHDEDEGIYLDKIILPIQNINTNPISYNLLNERMANKKCKRVLRKHRL